MVTILQQLPDDASRPNKISTDYRRIYNQRRELNLL